MAIKPICMTLLSVSHSDAQLQLRPRRGARRMMVEQSTCIIDTINDGKRRVVGKPGTRHSVLLLLEQFKRRANECREVPIHDVLQYLPSNGVHGNLLYPSACNSRDAHSSPCNTAALMQLKSGY
jgi:hypothetical protein